MPKTTLVKRDKLYFDQFKYRLTFHLDGAGWTEYRRNILEYKRDYNDFWALFKAATEDKKFEASFTWTVGVNTYYWQIVFYNMRFSESDVTIQEPENDDQDTIYTIVGSTWIDLSAPTNLPKITIKDGSAYA
jgi:hypothetical protein